MGLIHNFASNITLDDNCDLTLKDKYVEKYYRITLKDIIII